MTTAELTAYFDLLMDKTGTAYFLDSEKYSFLTQAQMEYIKQLLPSNEDGVVNLEQDHIVFNNIYTLVFETGALNPSAGVVTKTNVQTALNTASSSTEPFMYILNVSAAGVPVKYTRHNDWYTSEQNSFKKGTVARPKYRQTATQFIFTPTSAANIQFTLLKQPKTINVSTTSDLPEHTHKRVAELAVNIATQTLLDPQSKNGN